MKYCPRKVRRVAQEAQQEASPPRESPPAPVERPALPSSRPPPAARPSTPPAATQSSVQETLDVRVEIVLRPHGPSLPPLPHPNREPVDLPRAWDVLLNIQRYSTDTTTFTTLPRWQC